MTGHDDFQELVAGYALSALEPGDDLRLRQHLRGCADCRQLLVELTATAAELAYAAPEVEPPPQLLDRILASAGVGSQPAQVMALADGPARRARTRPGQRRVSMPLWTLTAAAGALVVLAATLVGLRLSHESAARDGTIASYQRLVGSLSQSGTQIVPLHGDGGPAGATAVVAGSTVTLVAHDLGINNASDSVYVLWTEAASNGRMIPLGKFDVTSEGVLLERATLPAGALRPWVFAVSEERGTAIPAVPHDQVLAS